MRKRTVLGFKPALDAGFEPRDYSWSPEVIPLGEYEVNLDFMIWSKKQVAVDCYCTIDGGKKIRLSAYRNKEDDYLIGATKVTYLSFGTKLMVNVGLNAVGNPKWLNAEVIL